MPCRSDEGKLDRYALREIEIDRPQLFVDDYLIENRFDEDKLSSTVPHVLHVAEHPEEPVLVPDRPWEEESGIGHPSALYDPEDDMVRMYYTVHQREMKGLNGYPPGSYFLCYAESDDGVSWRKPNLGKFSWGGEEDTNIIMEGEREAKIAHVHTNGNLQGLRMRNLGQLPHRFLEGNRFLMYYCDSAHYLATSQDGIEWRERVHEVISNRIDCYITIVHDDQRGEFVSFLRNRLIFSGKESEDYFGNTRMICRLSSRELWSRWDTMPSSVLIPDEDDSERFYGMPAFRYGGVYHGFLQHFYENPQKIEVELVFSRDGFNWTRLPGHPKLISVGEEGEWDSGMVATGDKVIEKGDEWWLYYSGYSGYHDETDRQSCIGLLRFRKEGFVSIHAGDRTSYLLTKPIRWPGGGLEVNAKADGGYVRFRVTDQRRRTIEGFGYEDCSEFTGDEVRHAVEWDSAEMADLAGKIIRLEFKFRNADIYSFVPSSGDPT